MKLSSVTSILALALPSLAFASDSERDLQITPGDWSMNNPTVSYNPTTEFFTISQVHGPMEGGTIGDGQVFMQLWKGECPHGEPAANTPAQGGLAVILGNSLSSSGPGWLEWGAEATSGTTSTWDFKIKAGVAAATDVYTPDPPVSEGGTVYLCIKTVLRKGNPGPHVNFREMELTIDYDLTSGFTASDFQTQAYDPSAGSADVSYTTTTTDCGATGLYNQGDTICTQVCADSTVVEVVAFKQMSVTGVGTPIPTPDDPEPAFPIWTNYVAEPLTVAATTPVGKCLQTFYMLRGNFFPYDRAATTAAVNTISGVHQNTVTGTVQLAVTRRRLDGSVERVLQEEEADFDTKVFTVGSAESSAKTSAIGGAAAAGALGAAALLL